MALALGRTVSELEASLSSTEFTEWMAYYTLEPFGQWRDNWHSAQLASLLYNINRGKNKALETADFMYLDPESAQDKRDQEFVASLTAMAKQKNG